MSTMSPHNSDTTVAVPADQPNNVPTAADPADVEKQPRAKPAMPTFPEGGLMGWLAVFGAWFASKSRAIATWIGTVRVR